MHTNQTVNYDLSQFIGTDIPNPLTDYNGDMTKIDTAIKDVADTCAGYATEIADIKAQNGSEALDTTAQTLSGAVNELNTEYGDVNSRLTVAEGKITADEGTLATAVGNISTLAGKVSAVETKVGTAVLTTVAPDLSGAINELKAEIGGGSSSLENRVTALETQNGSEVLQTTAQTLSGAINELYNAPASGVDADDVSYDNTSSGLTATNVQDAVDELKDDIVLPFMEEANYVGVSQEISAGSSYTAPADGLYVIFVSCDTGNAQLFIDSARTKPLLLNSGNGTTVTHTFYLKAGTAIYTGAGAGARYTVRAYFAI